MPATPAWLAPVENVLNRNIGTQAEGPALLCRLEGKSLQVNAIGLMRIRVRAHAEHGRLVLLAGDDSPADAILSGSVPALLAMMRGAPAPAAGANAVKVSGDAEIAGMYRELLALARPDPEEEASRILGDVPARRLGNLARGALTWLKGAKRSIGENIAEYLTEESRDLVNRTELEEFLRGVDSLREGADRLEARIQRLDGRTTENT
jgi:ubiquinone biosynthesis protein UbiJ